MAALFALVVDMATAQEVVSDELIRDRVTSYTPTSDNYVNNLTTVNYIGHKAEESVLWTNDIRIGYGAPGIFSLLILDGSVFYYDDIYIPDTLPYRLDYLRTNRGPPASIQSISVSASPLQQRFGWLSM